MDFWQTRLITLNRRCFGTAQNCWLHQYKEVYFFKVQSFVWHDFFRLHVASFITDLNAAVYHIISCVTDPASNFHTFPTVEGNENFGICAFFQSKCLVYSTSQMQNNCFGDSLSPLIPLWQNNCGL